MKLSQRRPARVRRATYKKLFWRLIVLFFVVHHRVSWIASSQLRKLHRVKIWVSAIPSTPWGRAISSSATHL